jgi:ABC-type sugar transport system substrate-binding protein
MKKRFLSTMLATALCASMFVGCGSSASTDSTTGTEETTNTEAQTETESVRVAFVVGDMSGGLTTELLNSCQEAADEKNVDFTFKEAVEDADKIEAIENFTNAGYDVIITSVGNAEAMEPAIASAQEAGIKVMVWDTDVEIADAFIGNDDAALGRGIGTMAANWINETFDSSETVNVAVVNYPDVNFIITRENGILEALEELAPNAKVVATQSAPTKPGGVEVGEVWMQSDLDIDCVVAINDAGATGVYDAFIAAGVDPQDEKLGFFGCDGIEDALNLIKEGGIYRGTLNLDASEAGGEIIDRAIKLANGEELEDRNYYFDIQQITTDNIDSVVTE